MVHDRFGRRLRIAPYNKMRGIGGGRRGIEDARLSAEMHRRLQFFINFKALQLRDQYYISKKEDRRC